MQFNIRFAIAAAGFICALAAGAAGQSGSASNVDQYENAYEKCAAAQWRTGMVLGL